MSMDHASHVLAPPSLASLSVSSHLRMSAEAEKLAIRIERQVRRQTGDKVRELKVEVHRDGIVLKGRCGTYYCKQLAQHAAMGLAGDRPLTNEIDVW
jgi:osmotically-inducible protein OsmY